MMTSYDNNTAFQKVKTVQSGTEGNSIQRTFVRAFLYTAVLSKIGSIVKVTDAPAESID